MSWYYLSVSGRGVLGGNSVGRRLSGQEDVLGSSPMSLRDSESVGPDGPASKVVGSSLQRFYDRLCSYSRPWFDVSMVLLTAIIVTVVVDFFVAILQAIVTANSRNHHAMLTGNFLQDFLGTFLTGMSILAVVSVAALYSFSIRFAPLAN